MKLSRRQFIQAGAGAAIAAAGGFCYLLGDTGVIELVQEEIKICDLPSEFEGYRIGFISDTHVGSYVPHEWIERAIYLLNREGVDLFVLGGDYIGFRDSLFAQKTGLSRNNRFDAYPPEALAEVLFQEAADLFSNARANDGVFAVYGNHDRYVTHAKKVSALLSGGVKPLKNDLETIKRGASCLTLVGVDDLRYGRPKLPKMSKKVIGNEIRILVTHNPDYISERLEREHAEFDFIVAGHTHGGQIKFPVVGALAYSIDDLRFSEGLTMHGDSYVYTSRGVGVVKFPWRLNCAPEATVFQLTRA